MESFSQYSLSNNILKLKKYDKKQAKKPHKKVIELLLQSNTW